MASESPGRSLVAFNTYKSIQPTEMWDGVFNKSDLRYRAANGMGMTTA